MSEGEGEGEGEGGGGGGVLPNLPWRFGNGAWMELRKGRGIAGGVAFGRAVLMEWAEREGLVWNVVSVGE